MHATTLKLYILLEKKRYDEDKISGRNYLRNYLNSCKDPIKRLKSSSTGKKIKVYECSFFRATNEHRDIRKMQFKYNLNIRETFYLCRT